MEGVRVAVNPVGDASLKLFAKSLNVGRDRYWLNH
jgi:hypothetical protein